MSKNLHYPIKSTMYFSCSACHGTKMIILNSSRFMLVFKTSQLDISYKIQNKFVGRKLPLFEYEPVIFFFLHCKSLTITLYI